MIKTTYADPGYSAADAGILYGPGQQTQPVIWYTYDTLGNLISETDARFGGNSATTVRTSYLYDEFGQVCQATSPAPWNGGADSTVVSSNTYYADGQLNPSRRPAPTAAS